MLGLHHAVAGQVGAHDGSPGACGSGTAQVVVGARVGTASTSSYPTRESAAVKHEVRTRHGDRSARQGRPSSSRMSSIMVMDGFAVGDGEAAARLLDDGFVGVDARQPSLAYLRWHGRPGLPEWMARNSAKAMRPR